jgi:NitT/TauT family transport system substrate-binding protein
MIDRRHLIKGALAATAMSGLAPSTVLGAGDPLRVAAVKYGSVNWLLDTIKAEGLDEKAGLTIAPVELSNNQAGPISLLSGNADVIVSDWTWALRQRGLGEPVKFAPYSSALGGVMVPKGSGIKTLKDLAGRRFGVAGSAIDKSWLLLQTYARSSLDFDIATKATIQFGAAPLLTEQLRGGQVDAMLNFWTQNARLSDGFDQIMSINDAMKALAIDPIPAFVGFVWKETTEATKRTQILSFLSAASAANGVLASSDAAWIRLKPLLKSSSDAEFEALKSAYRSGIVGSWSSADMASAEKLMQLLIQSGDTELVGSATKFDRKLFHVANA